jgi:hypothetical protein
MSGNRGLPVGKPLPTAGGSVHRTGKVNPVRDPRAGRRTTTVAASGRARGSIHCARGVARGQPL